MRVRVAARRGAGYSGDDSGEFPGGTVPEGRSAPDSYPAVPPRAAPGGWQRVCRAAPHAPATDRRAIPPGFPAAMPGVTGDPRPFRARRPRPARRPGMELLTHVAQPGTTGKAALTRASSNKQQDHKIRLL